MKGPSKQRSSEEKHMLRALALAAANADPGANKVTVALPAGAADRYVHTFRVTDGMPVEAKLPALVATPPKADERDGEQIDGLAQTAAQDLMEGPSRFSLVEF